MSKYLKNQDQQDFRVEIFDEIFSDEIFFCMTLDASVKLIKPGYLTHVDLPTHASSSQALSTLHWHPMSHRRKFHRCCFVYKILNNMVDSSTHETIGSDLHCYDTRNKMLVRPPKTNNKTNALFTF